MFVFVCVYVCVCVCVCVLLDAESEANSRVLNQLLIASVHPFVFKKLVSRVRVVG